MKHFSRFSINLLTKELDKLPKPTLFTYSPITLFIVNIALNKKLNNRLI
jgi:hypothetical protein